MKIVVSTYVRTYVYQSVVRTYKGSTFCSGRPRHSRLVRQTLSTFSRGFFFRHDVTLLLCLSSFFDEKKIHSFHFIAQARSKILPSASNRIPDHASSRTMELLLLRLLQRQRQLNLNAVRLIGAIESPCTELNLTKRILSPSQILRIVHQSINISTIPEHLLQHSKTQQSKAKHSKAKHITSRPRLWSHETMIS